MGEFLTTIPLYFNQEEKGKKIKLIQQKSDKQNRSDHVFSDRSSLRVCYKLKKFLAKRRGLD